MRIGRQIKRAGDDWSLAVVVLTWKDAPMRLCNISLLFIAALMVSLATSVFGDSGGPYVAVPDASAAERGPVFPILQIAKPLRHFITHMPKLTWNKSINEQTGSRSSPSLAFTLL